MLDDLFTYRLDSERLPDRHQRRQPRARPRVVPRSTRATSPTREVSDRIDDYAMLAVQGPQRARDRAGDLRRAAAAADDASRRAGSPARDVLVCGTGYTGEDGVELLLRARARAARCGMSSCAAAPRPAGLGARDTLRLEVCFHLYGNDLSDRARADRGRPRLVLQGGHRLRRRRRRARRARAPARARGSSRSRSTAGGIARAGQPDRRRRRGDQRDALADARHRHRDGLRAGRARARSAATSRSTFVARCAAPWSSRSRSIERQPREWPTPATPTTCSTTPSTTGRGSTPTAPSGDARHHLVRAGLARRGRLLRAAGGRRERDRRTRPTPRSSRSRRSPT